MKAKQEKPNAIFAFKPKTPESDYCSEQRHPKVQMKPALPGASAKQKH